MTTSTTNFSAANAAQFSNLAQEVLAALAPRLQAFKEEIVASNTLGNNKLQEALLAQIVELNQEIAASSGRIKTLEHQIMQIRNAQKASPLPDTNAIQDNNKQTIEKGKKPEKKVHSTGTRTVNKTKVEIPNLVGKKRKEPTNEPTTQKQEKLVSPKYPTVEREIIICFENPTLIEANDNTADLALELVTIYY